MQMYRYTIISGWVIAILILAELGAAPAQGCEAAYEVLAGSDAQLVGLPDADFLLQLKRALPPQKAGFNAVQSEDDSYGKATANSGGADLKAAIRNNGWTAARKQAALSSYETARKRISSYTNTMDTYRESLKWMLPAERAKVKKPTFKPPKVSDNLPAEFADYLRGAIAWHAGNIKQARAAWRATLKLPEDQRKYRSVWAAYMLGRSYVGINRARVVKWMIETRKLAKLGYVDSTGLAAASYGWQAKAVYPQDRTASMRFYARQLATGDKSAAASLRMCAAEMLKSGGKVLVQAARDPISRIVITADLVAGPSVTWIASDNTGPTEVQKWLAAIEKANVHDVAGASRLAWAAYRTGLMNQAQRWVDRAGKNNVMACWLRAKLLMRAGKIPVAEHQLTRAMQHDTLKTNASEKQQDAQLQRDQNIREELAYLQLSNRKYVAALDTLLDGTTYADWSVIYDGQYLAERLLSTDELMKYVNARLHRPPGKELKEILARRLVREGRYKQARPYFDSDDRKTLDEYIKAIRRGNNQTLSRRDRANAFWKAATIVHNDGWCLMGYISTYTSGHKPDGRFHDWLPYIRAQNKASFKIAKVSQDELHRAKRHRPKPPSHWSSLYVAEDHAWHACELMPDNDPVTAKRLYEAGTWIEYLDPQAANRFYKALVLRCGKTQLGQEAAKIHWFPKFAPSDRLSLDRLPLAPSG